MRSLLRKTFGDPKMANISDLVGKTLKCIEVTQNAKNGADDEIVFITESGETYKMYHYQDCCESVTIDDICGDIKDLLGSPILKAEERSNSESFNKEVEYDSFTWTFYEIATINGYVTIRWFGNSNGYYSESVDFDRVE